MGNYYFAFKKSQDGTKTLIVYRTGGMFSGSPEVVSVFTGDEAEQLYYKLTDQKKVVVK